MAGACIRSKARTENVAAVSCRKSEDTTHFEFGGSVLARAFVSQFPSNLRWTGFAQSTWYSASSLVYKCLCQSGRAIDDQHNGKRQSH